MAPVGTCLFYIVTSVLQGETSQIPSKLKEKFVPTVIASYTLWPAAHAINFKFVPSQQRILYTNVVSVSKLTPYIPFAVITASALPSCIFFCQANCSICGKLRKAGKPHAPSMRMLHVISCNIWDPHSMAGGSHRPCCDLYAPGVHAS